MTTRTDHALIDLLDASGLTGRGGAAFSTVTKLRAAQQHGADLIVNAWNTPLWGSGTVDGYFKAQTDLMLKPMTSLRDVDQSGVIQASTRDGNGHGQSFAEVQQVMDLIRHGVANNDGADNGQSGD